MRRKGWGEENQDKVQYAYQLGGEQFVYLLNAENGEWTYQRRHQKIPGTVGIDYGLCGTNSVHHPEILHDKRFFTNWKWQMEQCYKMYVGGVTFYGKNNIEKQKPLFYFINK